MHDVFYFTDLHGRMDLFNMMRDWCYSQDTECTIIYGGDACDRGENGYEIIQELLADPQIVYLYGNHEDLFVQAVDAIIGYCASSDEAYAQLHNFHTEEDACNFIATLEHNEAVYLHLANGGLLTLVHWLLDGANEEIIDQLRNLPRVYRYNQIDISHAGYTASAFDGIWAADEQTAANAYDLHEIIWNRSCLALGWATDRIGVFGHTPTASLPAGIYGRDKSLARIRPCAWQDKMGAIEKRGGWKIDMDTGAVWTGRAYVLNLLTLNVIGFYADPNITASAFETYKII